MFLFLRCPKCQQKVGCDASQEAAACPTCKRPLIVTDPVTKTFCLAPGVAPAWMKPWGIVLIVVGVLAYIGTVLRIGPNSGDWSSALGYGLLNPIAWAGLGLGIYWVTRARLPESEVYGSPLR